MVRSSFLHHPEYLLRVDGKVFGILFQTLKEAEEMAGHFVTRGAAKVVIVRNRSGVAVKRLISDQTKLEEKPECDGARAKS